MLAMSITDPLENQGLMQYAVSNGAMGAIECLLNVVKVAIQPAGPLALV
jgi:hypothetical protein